MNHSQASFLILLATTMACDGAPSRDAAVAPDSGTVLQTIPGGDSQINNPRSLCELISYAQVIGHYEVERIESNMGPNLINPDDDKPTPVTVVSLTGASWHGEDDPKVKMGGGEMPDGSIIAAEVSFTAGEEVVAFLGTPREDGTWAPSLESVLYKQETGGFASDVLLNRGVYSAADIEELVTAALNGDCTNDVPPDHVLDEREARDRVPSADEEEHTVDPDAADAGSADGH